MSEPLTPEEVAVLVRMIEDQREEIARLRSQQSLLGVLREIALDPAVPPHLRLKAAEAGVSFEQPKLSASVIGIGRADNYGDQLDAAKANRAIPMEERVRRARLRVIDAEPA